MAGTHRWQHGRCTEALQKACRRASALVIATFVVRRLALAVVAGVPFGRYRSAHRTVILPVHAMIMMSGRHIVGRTREGRNGCLMMGRLRRHSRSAQRQQCQGHGDQDVQDSARHGHG
jgi:hypothetical protein